MVVVVEKEQRRNVLRKSDLTALPITGSAPCEGLGVRYGRKSETSARRRARSAKATGDWSRPASLWRMVRDVGCCHSGRGRLWTARST